MPQRLERVQLLLEPEQRQALRRIARAGQSSVSGVARSAIAIGLADLERRKHLEARGHALLRAKRRRASLPPLDVEVARSMAAMREERDGRRQPR